MDIVYLTDIHDNLKRLRYVILSTKADLYIISGDLIYKAFFTEERLYEFVSIQEEFYSFLAQKKMRGTPSELAQNILKTPSNYTPELVQKAHSYEVLFQKAANNMKDKYQILKDLVEKYASKAEILFLPGNYDMDLQYTALYPYDLHKKCRELGEIKFCGYGGAPIATSGIPELVSVVFYEYMLNGNLHSEPREFFEQTHPDVMILHNPAYNTLDKITAYGHVGSHGLRHYIDHYSPALVLSGHVHSCYGVMKVNNTICINPSNFGAVDTLAGYDDGGYYCRIAINPGSRAEVQKVTLYRCIDREIKTIVEVNIDPALKLTETVIDSQEYAKLGGFIQ